MMSLPCENSFLYVISILGLQELPLYCCLMLSSFHSRSRYQRHFTLFLLCHTYSVCAVQLVAKSLREKFFSLGPVPFISGCLLGIRFHSLQKSLVSYKTRPLHSARHIKPND